MRDSCAHVSNSFSSRTRPSCRTPAIACLGDWQAHIHNRMSVTLRFSVSLNNCHEMMFGKLIGAANFLAVENYSLKLKSCKTVSLFSTAARLKSGRRPGNEATACVGRCTLYMQLSGFHTIIKHVTI